MLDDRVHALLARLRNPLILFPYVTTFFVTRACACIEEALRQNFCFGIRAFFRNDSTMEDPRAVSSTGEDGQDDAGRMDQHVF
jgi:hypothetical protein